MKQKLNERDGRLYFATEALRLGYGGITQVAKSSGVSRVTITKGIAELEKGNSFPARIRMKGGGRKRVTEIYPEIKKDLQLLTNPKGDPMKKWQWTTKSIVKLAAPI